MFVMNCSVNKEEILRYKAPENRKKRRGHKKMRSNQEGAAEEAETDVDSSLSTWVPAEEYSLKGKHQDNMSACGWKFSYSNSKEGLANRFRQIVPAGKEQKVKSCLWVGDHAGRNGTGDQVGKSQISLGCHD